MQIPFTLSECEQERSPQELDEWATAVFERFSANHTTKGFVRRKKELLKKFVEEIVPLCRIGKHKFWTRSDITLKPRMGNQPYGAEIIVRKSRAQRIIRLEIGTAIDGYSDSLLMEYFQKHGTVCLSGSIWREGSKASGGQVCNENGCRDRKKMLEELFNLVHKLANNKMAKTYEPETLLAIVFDDYLPFDLKTDSTALEASISLLLPHLLRKFVGFFLVGQSGKYFHEYGPIAI